jgi:hypothetical protein
VRAEGGERTMDVTLPPGPEDALWLWQYGCDNPVTTNGVSFAFREVISRTGDALRIRADAYVGPGVSTVDITAVVSETPGLTVQASDLPVTLTGDREAEPVELTWTVPDCAQATTVLDVTLGVTVVGDQTGAVHTRLQAPIDTPMLVELVRFTTAVCET